MKHLREGQGGIASEDAGEMRFTRGANMLTTRQGLHPPVRVSFDRIQDLHVGWKAKDGWMDGWQYLPRYKS